MIIVPVPLYDEIFWTSQYIILLPKLTYEFQKPLFVNHVLASVAEENDCGVLYFLETYSAKLMKDSFVKSFVLSNPKDANVPGIGVG